MPERIIRFEQIFVDVDVTLSIQFYGKIIFTHTHAQYITLYNLSSCIPTIMFVCCSPLRKYRYLVSNIAGVTVIHRPFIWVLSKYSMDNCILRKNDEIFFFFFMNFSWGFGKDTENKHNFAQFAPCKYLNLYEIIYVCRVAHTSKVLNSSRYTRTTLYRCQSDSARLFISFMTILCILRWLHRNGNVIRMYFDK